MKKTKKGSLATSAKILEDLALTGQKFPNLILEWRQVSKLKKLSEDITWESAESFEKKVTIIKESYFAKKSTVEETVEEVTEEVDNSQTIEKVTVEEVEPQGSTLDPVMERYIKASVKLQKEAHGDIGKYLQ